MAEERINDIIAQEAFEQLASFGKALNELNEQMKEIIGTAVDVKKAMSSASGFKDVAEATTKANDVAKDYAETSRKSQEIHSKMKATFETVMLSVNKYDNAIDGAREAIKRVREETGQLILRVIDEKAAVDASAKSRKEQSKLLKESQEDLKAAKKSLESYIEKEKSVRDTIAATAVEMEREREENGKESAKYSELSEKMEAYSMMLESVEAEKRKYTQAFNDAQQAIDVHKDRLVELDIAESQHRASMSEAQLAAKQSMAIEAQQAGSINELRKQLSQYTSAYNALSEEERENIEIGVPLAEGMNAIKERLKELNNEQKNAGFAEGSYRQLNAELGALRNQYKALSEAERENDEIGGAMQARIQELDTKLKSLDKGIGQHQRNVGDYTMILDRVMNGEVSMRNAMKSMQIELNKTELRRRGLIDSIAQQEKAVQELKRTEGEGSSAYQEASQKLDQMNAEYSEATSKVNDLTEKLGNLKDVQADISRATQGMAADAGGIKAMTEGVGLLTNAYSVLQAGVVAMGADSQKLADIYNKVMVLQQGLNSVNKIANALQRESILRVRTRAAVDKIRALYMKANAAATSNETAATVANTAAEQANTAAKTGNAAATAGATAATGALAAGEGVATATSFTLVGALKAVGLAIKSIPVIGWILAAIAGIATLTTIIYKHLTAEKELTDEQKRRKEVQDAINESKTQAISNTQKEFIELDRNVSKIHSLKEGTEEYDKTVKAVADKLGISDKWLKNNIGKVDQLKEAWKRVRLAQAVADGLITKAADAQIKAEEDILALRQKSYKERKKELREQGYSRRNARSAASQDNIADTEAKIRARAAQTASDLIAQADRVEKEMENDIALVNDAQKAAAKESEKTTSSTVNKQKKEADSAMEYYKSIVKSMADEENKQLSKTAKGRLELLNKQKAEEAAKYDLAKLNNEQRQKIEEYYAMKRAQIMEEENARVQQSIAAAYAVQVETRLKMMEDEARRRGLQCKELSELLISIENERFAQEQKNREEAFKKETKDVEKGGAEYVAIRKKYDALYEKAVFDHEAKIGDIRASGIDGEFEKIRNAYKNLINELTIQRGGDELTEVEKLQLAAKQSREELELFESMTTEQLDTVRQVFEDGLITQEEYAERTDSILKGMGLTMAQYYAKLAELRANDVKSQKAADDAKNKSIFASSMVIADSFQSIGDSLSQLTGESIGMTIAMQAIAMAQVLANQAVAISAAIEKAMSDPKNVNVMMAIASAASGVAAVLAQVVSAKSAIDQSRQALSNVNTYAEGTSHHPGGDAVVGEGGRPELVTAGGKNFVIDKPTLIKDLPVGAKVTPLDTKSLDNYQQVDLSEVLASMNRIENRDRVHIDVGRNVYAYIVKGASRARVLNKQFSH